MCFILCMLWISSLCSNLSDRSGFRCGSSVLACVFHYFSNYCHVKLKVFVGAFEMDTSSLFKEE